jgi:Tfp pilus assembly protein PilZ
MPSEVDASLVETRVRFHNTTVSSTPERRRYPRIEILGRVRGAVRPLDVQITMLNLSLGGFLMQTPMQYQIGETHEFQLTMAQKDPIVVRARIAHAMPVTVEHGPLFLFGLEFVETGERASKLAIESLVSALQDPDAQPGH